MVKNRRRHTAAFKFRVALEAVEGSKTISQLSSEHGIHANQIGAWKRQLLEDGPNVFASNGERKFLGGDCLGRPRALGRVGLGGGLAAKPWAMSASYSAS